MKKVVTMPTVKEESESKAVKKLDELMKVRDQNTINDTINEISDLNLLEEMIIIACKAISKKNKTSINSDIKKILNSLTEKYTKLIKNEKLDNKKLFKSMWEHISNSDENFDEMAKYIIKMTDQYTINETLLVMSQCLINNKLIYLPLAKGADVNYLKSTVTPLTNASQFGNNLAVKSLLEYKANPNLEAYNTPLVFACVYDNKKIVSFLLKAKANPNNGKNNPLISTVEQNLIEIAKLLLEHGADVNFKHNGNSALSVANEKVKNEKFCYRTNSNYEKMLELLIESSNKASENSINKDLNILGNDNSFFEDDN